MSLHVGRLLVPLAILLLLLSSPALALDFLYPAKIEKVIDGDTMVADLFLSLGGLSQRAFGVKTCR